MKTIIREADTLLEKAGAEYSPCEKYRYRLWRIWDESAKPCVFIGLNPSKATELILDNTVRRCVNYARDWGYGGLHMLNIFAYRATDPKDMFACVEPIGGPRNDEAILETVALGGVTVAAWGAHGIHLDRGAAVRQLVPQLHHLHLTAQGHPGHPLYLSKKLKPIKW